jgi:hypothetical protein
MRLFQFSYLYEFEISNQSNPGTQPPCPPSLGKRRGVKTRVTRFFHLPSPSRRRAGVEVSA